MNREEILKRLEPIFQTVFNDDELDVNIDLVFEDMDEWSSISLALMVTEVELAFGIKFKLLEVAQMNDMSTLVNFIENKI